MVLLVCRAPRWPPPCSEPTVPGPSLWGTACLKQTSQLFWSCPNIYSTDKNLRTKQRASQGPRSSDCQIIVTKHHLIFAFILGEQACSVKTTAKGCYLLMRVRARVTLTTRRSSIYSDEKTKAKKLRNSPGHPDTTGTVLWPTR